MMNCLGNGGQSPHLCMQVFRFTRAFSSVHFSFLQLTFWKKIFWPLMSLLTVSNYWGIVTSPQILRLLVLEIWSAFIFYSAIAKDRLFHIMQKVIFLRTLISLMEQSSELGISVINQRDQRSNLTEFHY